MYSTTKHAVYLHRYANSRSELIDVPEIWLWESVEMEIRFYQ